MKVKKKRLIKNENGFYAFARRCRINTEYTVYYGRIVVYTFICIVGEKSRAELPLISLSSEQSLATRANE